MFLVDEKIDSIAENVLIRHPPGRTGKLMSCMVKAMWHDHSQCSQVELKGKPGSIKPKYDFSEFHD